MTLSASEVEYEGWPAGRRAKHFVSCQEEVSAGWPMLINDRRRVKKPRPQGKTDRCLKSDSTTLEPA